MESLGGSERAAGRSAARSKKACDMCHAQKVACSKERDGCEKCRRRGNPCVYSADGRQNKVMRPRTLRPNNNSNNNNKNPLDPNYLNYSNTNNNNNSNTMNYTSSHSNNNNNNNSNMYSKHTARHPQNEKTFHGENNIDDNKQHSLLQNVVAVWDVEMAGFETPQERSHSFLPTNPLPPSATCLPLNLLIKKYNWNTDEPFVPQLLEVEHPDLLPTMEDWMLCAKWLTNNNSKRPEANFWDADAFLRDFWILPPALRLVRCATAGFSLRLPDETQYKYYLRARKALYHEGVHNEPSFYMAQVYFNLCTFAACKGQPDVGNQFLKQGLQMMLELRLDIDPDDSGWLYHLTPRQKEERRRLFWAYYQVLVVQQSTVPDSIEIQLDASRVKDPQQVLDPEAIYPEKFAFLKHEIEVLDLIGRIKRAYFIPPTSPQDLLSSGSEIRSRYYLFHASVPSDCRLVSDSPLYISDEDERRFIGQTLAQQATVCDFNLCLHASVIVYYRPRLFLTKLRSFHPLVLDSDTRTLLSHAISQSVESALRTITLVTFAKTSKRVAEDLTEEHQSDYFLLYGEADALLQAFLVLWFVYCRMDPDWWKFWAHPAALDIPRFMQTHASVVRACLEDDLAAAGEFDGTSPFIARCFQEIMLEIETIESIGFHAQAQKLRQDRDMYELELGMKVMALGVRDSDGSSPSELKEPCVYLGLLGEVIGSSVRFKGRTEESWRLFWKLHE